MIRMTRWRLILFLFLFLSGLYLSDSLSKNHSESDGNGTGRSEPIGISQENLDSIVNPPGPNATDEEKDRFFQLVAKVATPANFLEVSSCLPSPIAFLTEYKQPMSFMNNDSVEHSIIINKDHVYTVLPNSSKTVIAEFGFGPGFYGYACDDPNKTAGMIFIVDQRLEN